MKNILLATDFSENASNAIDYAIAMFGKENATYTLLNSFVEMSSGTTVMISMHEYLQKESEERLAEEEKHIVHKYGSDLKLNVRSHFGSLSYVINKLHEENSFDYVVIGTKGATAMESFFIGSNTLEVVKSVEMPMLVIPNGKRFKGLNSIALAADYEHIESTNLIKPLFNLAKEFNASLKIVNVREDDNIDLDHSQEGFDLHNELEGIDHSFHTELNGHVVKGIENFMNNNDIDLLTMVARKHAFFERLFHKSVTREISMLAEAPMLILHE